MKYVSYLTTLGLLLLVAAQIVSAADTDPRVDEMRRQIRQMKEENKTQRMEFQESKKEQMEEFRSGRKDDAKEFRWEEREVVKDATTGAQKRRVIQERHIRNRELRGASMEARQSLWDKIRGQRQTLRSDQQQQRSSLFETFKSWFASDKR